MGFIEFPFIEVPKDLRKIVGDPTPGTRAYRREGTHAECGQWIEDLGLHYKGDVGNLVQLYKALGGGWQEEL
jgi:hypothetical protein